MSLVTPVRSPFRYVGSAASAVGLFLALLLSREVRDLFWNLSGVVTKGWGQGWIAAVIWAISFLVLLALCIAMSSLINAQEQRVRRKRYSLEIGALDQILIQIEALRKSLTQMHDDACDSVPDETIER